jgi:hypothetical protein
MNLSSRRAFLAALSLGSLRAADWNSPEFPGWSDELVLKLLTDSPWAKPKSVRFTWTRREERQITYKDVPGAQQTMQTPVGSPVGGIGAPKSKLPDKADLILRWASALPVRHARALYLQRSEKRPIADLNALIAARAPGYTLEIFGIPALIAHKGAGTVEHLLKQSAAIVTRSGRTIRPSNAQVAIQALSLIVNVHFPASEPISLADKEIEVSGDLQIFGFREKFKLGAMTYLGNLEL